MITPELTEVIEKIIESKLLDVHTSLPCIVESVNSATKTVSVVPQIKRILEDKDGNLNSEALPKLENIPIAIQKTNAGFFIALPVTAGDYGRIIFNEMSIGQWRELGIACSSGDIGRFPLDSAVFSPDLVPTAQTLTDSVVTEIAIGKSMGTQIRSKASTVEITTAGAVAATGFVATATKVEALWQALWTVFNTWVPVPQDGGAALKTAFLAAISPPFDVKSTNLKAD